MLFKICGIFAYKISQFPPRPITVDEKDIIKFIKNGMGFERMRLVLLG